MTYLFTIAVIFFITQNGIQVSGSTICTIFYTHDGVIEDSEGHTSKAISVSHKIKDVSGYANYTCPGKGHPDVWTNCCEDQGMEGCCPPIIYKFINLDRITRNIVAMIVISLGLAFFCIFSICCFWYPCPLYAVCNKVYVPDVADYEPRNNNPGLDAMPGEPIGNSYYPNIVIHERDVDNNAV
ncbi:hypothetical protein CDAR_263781 [Caerostris darwini]|uniref:Uncharacterized protein n=1 Tax=Caerostris darwini TaxID=1538125 RepID=A0AAV4VND5_9ARAC|nr:hypothetical protein CDAR_263781 [Caerostris darwini]